jgi:hypothetical protein
MDVSAASVQAASVRIAGLSTPRAASVVSSESSSSSSSSGGIVKAQSVASGLYVKYSYAATVELPCQRTVQTCRLLRARQLLQQRATCQLHAGVLWRFLLAAMP